MPDLIGKRVRLTCDESVIVGTVTDIDLQYIEMAMPGLEIGTFPLAHWAVEVIEPPLPTTPGSVIRATSNEARTGLWSLLPYGTSGIWRLTTLDTCVFCEVPDDSFTDVTVLFDAAGALDGTP